MRELKLTQSETQRLLSKHRFTQHGMVIDDPIGFIVGECEVIIFKPFSNGLYPIFTANDFAVYDKPCGLGVHPHSTQSPYTLNDEIKYLFGSDANAAHRIDQETSGLVLVSRNKRSEPVIKQMFAKHTITKRYLAMVRGEVQSPLDIRAPLLRTDDPDLSVSLAVRVHPDGKEAHTLIRPLQYFPQLDTTLIEASPLTGRSHQIRVHLFHVKHPIVGDPLYGQSENDIAKYINKELSREERWASSGASRLLLHAHSLEFEYKSNNYYIVSKEDFLKQCFTAMKFSPV